MARLTECDRCGSLAALESVREVYGEGQIIRGDGSGQCVTLEEDIVCPICGLRTQIVDPAEDCPA